METVGHGLSDGGRERDNNEDRFVAADDLGLYVVSDGMGGHAAGEVASATAIGVVETRVRSKRRLIEVVRKGGGDHDDLLGVLVDAVKAACLKVHRLATTHDGYSGMGCTLTALLVAGSRAVMAHVGDTRLYIYRDGAVEQLSTDHTLANEYVKSGRMTVADGRRSRHAHVLTRSVGYQEDVQVDALMLDVLPDDVLLLCSDGLSEYVEGHGELGAMLSQERPEDVPRRLIEMANERGGHDNITAVVVRVTASDEEQRDAMHLGASISLALEVLRSVELFRDVPLTDLFRILNLATIRTYDARETVVEEGRPCHRLFVVLAGTFHLTVDGVASHDLRRGDHVGDTTLLAERVAKAGLSAATHGTLLWIDGRDFLRLARQRPWVGVTLLVELGRQMSIELAGVAEHYGKTPAAMPPRPQGPQWRF